jgi:DNA-binding HxlR family transcriptional regulator
MPNQVPKPGQPVRGSKTGQPIMALFDLLGRSWALGILWNLSGTGMTFRQVQTSCGGVSPSVLNKRIKELTESQLIERDTRGYRLTPAGTELSNMLRPLGQWSDEWAKLVGKDS